MNREVNVTKRVETAQGLRYPCSAANGRIKPDAVLFNGLALGEAQVFPMDIASGRKALDGLGNIGSDVKAHRCR